MPNLSTFTSKAFPDTSLPKLDSINHWSIKLAAQFLTTIWDGIDLFKTNFSQIEITENETQIERDITSNLEGCLQDVLSGYEPFKVEYRIQHESWEMEHANARPPQYDIAFVMKANTKLKFPIEAKVLYTDGQVSDYVKDIKDEFLTCTYAPFSYEGVMLGYLLKGKPSIAFQNIEKSLGTKLKDYRNFTDRNHKFSSHRKKVPIDKKDIYPSKFRCHHIILEFTIS